MNKKETIEEIYTILTNSPMSENEKQGIIELIYEIKNKKTRKFISDRVKKGFLFRKDKNPLITQEQLLEETNILILEAVISDEEYKAIKNYLKSLHQPINESMYDSESSNPFNSKFKINESQLLQPKYISPPPKDLNIKHIGSITKSKFLLSSEGYNERSNLLSNSFKFSNITKVDFSNILDTFSYCFEYRLSGLEFYKGKPKKTPDSKMTVIITEMEGSNILNDSKKISNLCTHFYNKFVDFMPNPHNILWIIERPVSEGKSNYYQISFEIFFEFPIRDREDVYKLNHIFDTDLSPYSKQITIFSSSYSKIRKFKNLKHLRTIHQLHIILS